MLYQLADGRDGVDVRANCLRGEELRLLPAEKVAGGGLSTHALSLRMVCDYLDSRADMNIYLLAVQPAVGGVGEPMSPVVRKSIEYLAELLLEMFDGL